MAHALAGKVTGFGPRPSGSAAHMKMQEFLRATLREAGCTVTENRFTAQTPNGPIEMVNFIAAIPGKSDRAAAVSGHYDTKVLPGTFVGANDGGSSTGLLLELARVTCGKPREDTLYLVWFDGEEAVVQWSPSDSLYGSRHLAERWKAEGVLPKLKALVNVDMIGDRDLKIVNELMSTASLRKLVWETADELGYGAYFSQTGGPIEDDHAPFLRAGVPAVDLIDFEYGPNHSYWHTDQDTMDKLDPKSFQVVGEVVLAVLKKLEKQ